WWCPCAWWPTSPRSPAGRTPRRDGTRRSAAPAPPQSPPSALRFRPDLVHQRSQAVVVRAPPVDLPAGHAAPELVVVAAGQRLEPVEHLGLADVLERAPAAHAAGEGREAAGQVQSPHHLDRLLAGVLRPHVEAVGHAPALEQAPVAGEHDAVPG